MRLTFRTCDLGLDRAVRSIAPFASSISSQSSAPGSGESGACSAAQRRAVGPPAAQQCGEIDAARLPVVDRRVGLEQVDAADQVVEPAHAELRHELPHLLGDEEEEVDDVLGRAREALAQLRILRRDADRARVQVAGAHHHAAGRDQRRGREAHLVGAEQRRRSTTSRPVFSCPSVCTQMRERRSFSTSVCCVSARPISHGMPGALDRRERRRAGAAVVAGDEDVVGVRLRDTRRDGADADLGRRASPRPAHRGSRSGGRRSAAPDPRSSRCRGAAAARSARRPAS